MNKGKQKTKVMELVYTTSETKHIANVSALNQSSELRFERLEARITLTCIV